MTGKRKTRGSFPDETVDSLNTKIYDRANPDGGTSRYVRAHRKGGGGDVDKFALTQDMMSGAYIVGVGRRDYNSGWAAAMEHVAQQAADK